MLWPLYLFRANSNKVISCQHTQWWNYPVYSSHNKQFSLMLIDWLTTLRHISTERLLGHLQDNTYTSTRYQMPVSNRCKHLTEKTLCNNYYALTSKSYFADISNIWHIIFFNLAFAVSKFSRSSSFSCSCACSFALRFNSFSAFFIHVIWIRGLSRTS